MVTARKIWFPYLTAAPFAIDHEIRGYHSLFRFDGGWIFTDCDIVCKNPATGSQTQHLEIELATAPKRSRRRYGHPKPTILAWTKNQA